MQTCGAKTRGGTSCKNAKMPNGRCRMHGGKSLKGIAHPNFKDGLRSKHMPKPLKEAFDQAVADPGLLDLTGSIATQEAIVVDLLDSLNGADAPTKLVSKIRNEWRDFWQATAREDHGAVAKHREIIGTLLARAATVAATIDRISQAEEQKRKLIDTEMRRREKGRTLIPIEDVMWHIRNVMLANREIILEFDGLSQPDRRELLRLVADRYVALLGDVGATA